VIPSVSNPNSSYTARYFYGSNVPFPPAGLGLPTGVIRNEQWLVTSNGCPADNNASVGFDYINPNDQNAWFPPGLGPNTTPPCSDCNIGVVARYGGSWDFTGDPGTFSAARPEYRYWESNGRVYGQYGNICGMGNYFSFGHQKVIVLPIRLLTFTGSLQDKQALLQWTVADNEEVGSFEVEYSTDGQIFRRIGIVQKGNNPAYRFTHPNLVPGNNYYRLLLKGSDGTREYSKVVVIPYGNAITYILGIQPTLVKESTQLRVVSARQQSVEMKIYDMRGRLIRTERAQMQTGSNTVPLYMKGLAPAMYIVYIHTDDGAQANYKVVKE
jgi:hypothetical protein